MTPDLAQQLISSMLWNAFLIALPLLGVTLLVGLLVSVVQVVTQLQEMSLSYIPKLVATLLVMVVLGPWMLSRLTTYATDVIKMISTLN
ncbi:flagellar biosynthetic protein FliQ [Cupriavidus basilensis]|uniref:Flagellar biosynthetic protein FliQ n=1 Tax=Cupriavidus basilensis TaxID=68895 RepID=A0ABT6AW35_9BURK|nr:flagellar biosynthetic protein FliQ [Cupriavidus basilensis]MDF3836843.1 flagellar biosynthetic protein FliQ [Cupriavidus basilensis]